MKNLKKIESHEQNVHNKMQKEHMIIMEGEHPHGHEMKIITEGEEGDNIQITVEIDEEGNKVIKKTVNGEEIEMTEEELKKMHEHKEGELMIIKMDSDDLHRHNMEFVTEGEEGDNIQITVEIDEEGNKVIKKTVNGEEVEVTEDEIHQMHKGHNGNFMMMHHINMDDSDMTEEEKKEMMKKLEESLSQMNITLDSLGENMEFEFETLFDEIHGEDGEHSVIIKKIEMDGDDVEWESHQGHHGHRMKMIHGGDEDFTIVLVTENITESDANVVVQRELETNDMMIYPNPNNGVFTIQFDQTEKVKTKVEVIDAQGKAVFADKLGKFSGNYKKEIDLKKFGSGMYTIKVEQGGKIMSSKVIVD